jgi:nucleotidyltransferase/DNA polymerase involved in DNA repair
MLVVPLSGSIRSSCLKSTGLPLALELLAPWPSQQRTANVILPTKFNDFEVITRSRSVPVGVSSRSDLESLSIALLQNELPVPKPVRLLGVSLSSLQGEDESAGQLTFLL